MKVYGRTIRKNGQGTYTNANPRYKYTGEWLNNEINGKGKMEYVGGDVYDGYWENHKRCGYGKLETSYCTHTGLWKNNLANGFGITIFKNGDKYEGNMLDGKRHGEGASYSSDCRYYKGMFLIINSMAWGHCMIKMEKLYMTESILM